MQCWCPLMIGLMPARKSYISTTGCTHMALPTWTVASGAICHYLGVDGRCHERNGEDRLWVLVLRDTRSGHIDGRDSCGNSPSWLSVACFCAVSSAAAERADVKMMSSQSRNTICVCCSLNAEPGSPHESDDMFTSGRISAGHHLAFHAS